MRDGIAYVVNLDSKGNEGTHWVAARRIGKRLYYADPFGILLDGYPPMEMLDKVQKIYASSVTYQHPSNSLCGYYAIVLREALCTLRGDETQVEYDRKVCRYLTRE